MVETISHITIGASSHGIAKATKPELEDKLLSSNYKIGHETFKALAACLEITYLAPIHELQDTVVHTHEGCMTFPCRDTAVPRFPADHPPQHRPVYWKDHAGNISHNSMRDLLCQGVNALQTASQDHQHLARSKEWTGLGSKATKQAEKYKTCRLEKSVRISMTFFWDTALPSTNTVPSYWRTEANEITLQSYIYI